MVLILRFFINIISLKICCKKGFKGYFCIHMHILFDDLIFCTDLKIDQWSCTKSDKWIYLNYFIVQFLRKYRITLEQKKQNRSWTLINIILEVIYIDENDNVNLC